MEADKVSLTYGPVIPSSSRKGQKAVSKPFGDMLTKAIGEVNKTQNSADKAIDKANTGTGSLSDAMIALGKADIALKTMLQVRNKVIEAYQEIMRLQV
ncbi:MAG: flagellar hook-basal body complex protein FliE [Syntrophales bacterium]|nr:flagellar hook-basal body complex protein FliE [Syntrophales bacterium]